jgi:2-polyprenyl-3-methyl-5-hydroxy-6-metoxy-1,4-benzoquinol methylase
MSRENTNMKNINSAPGIKEKVLQMISSSKSKLDILEVGPGRGYLAEELRKKGNKIICLDLKNNLDFDLPFKQGDLNKKLPFKKGSFDLILCTELIDEIENPRMAIREFKRIIRKNGRIILSTTNILSIKARLYFLLKGTIYGFNKRDYIYSHHISPLAFYDFKRICIEQKLKIEETKYNNSGNSLFGEILILKIKNDQ